MKILHISKFYPPYRGGIEDVCLSVVESLKGNEQMVICFNTELHDKKEVLDGIPVYRVGILGELKSQPISFSYFFKLKKIVNEFRPDVIHLHLPNPLLCLYVNLLKKTSAKLILHWHSDIIAQSVIYKCIRSIERKTLENSEKIIVTSPSYLDASEALKDFRSKTVVIPNPISLTKMEMNEEDFNKVEDIKEQYKKKIIFFMGRHVEYKGIKYLLEAEKFVKSDCVILIAGKGPLTTSLMASTHSDRVKFLGRIADEDIKVYMHAADVFAFPSITKNEAFGVVLAEAMYCKATPICFTIPGSGVNWVSINGETGLEVENSNAVAFANGIDKLLNDDSYRLSLAEKAYNRVVNLFTMKIIGKEVQDLYNKL